MPAATDRLEFAPPPQPGTVRAFVLAILAHVLLMLALTWGISWNRESENMVAEAELWSSVPKQAAPRAATAPPVVQAPPMPTVPAPPPPPAPKIEPTPPAPVPKPPDIALEQEKRKQERAQRRQEELERQRQEQLEQQKKLEARKKEEDLRKRELAEQKAAEEKKRKEEQVKAAKAREQEDAKRLEALRQDNLKRMQAQADATGAPSSTGTALRSSGPSVGYANRIAARIKPNIVFNDIVSGNPSAEVEIRVAPDGTIVGRKLTKSSGVKSWDDAVLRAIDKTEVLPRDTDGTVVPQFPIHFRPHD